MRQLKFRRLLHSGLILLRCGFLCKTDWFIGAKAGDCAKQNNHEWIGIRVESRRRGGN
jgi:hypothetical protein